MRRSCPLFRVARENINAKEASTGQESSVFGGKLPCKGEFPISEELREAVLRIVWMRNSVQREKPPRGGSDTPQFAAAFQLQGFLGESPGRREMESVSCVIGAFSCGRATIAAVSGGVLSAAATDETLSRRAASCTVPLARSDRRRGGAP
ncbi:hypothetical protein cyc_04644 [Cyclospora cayetanensis]|uniref:Uncharacterized protein n=1 Tax=Cyclospora cayetanensis TaxID=88456 RepID=A0A1D3CYT8_9EIME|nr:hypothetical protein cyc_04644 [Cyclospora cayetanensis]